MKKVLSVFLAVVMLLGCVSIGVVAAGDTCIKLSDTSGSSGYSAGSDAVNEWIVENDGGTLIFDVKLESVATPGSGKVSRLVAFTGADPYNYAGYDFTNSRFIAGSGSNWPTATQTTTYTAYSTRSYTWNTGEWHEIAYQFNGTEATVYFDGIPMVSAELDASFDTEYMILYPQYCTVLIDNMRICGKDYNVRDRYGDVYAATDFTGITAVSGASLWTFSDGYSVSTDGRAMPELGEMLPERTVSPAIDGAYLKYSEGGGIGVAASAINFTPYNGFTYIETVRVDRKSALACMGIRFGDYIAGYDWDTSTFRIANKAGYSFSTSAAYTYATTEYALSMKTAYEFAVRVDGNVASVYLNGILMAQAVNDAFATGFASVDVVHYRMGASVDNVVVAYPDYNVREAIGSAAAKFTFDEAATYIDGIWDYNLDTGNSGYSIAKEMGAAAVTVANVEAADNKAVVGITLANCTEFTSFKLDIAYDSKLSVAQAIPQSILDGSYAFSSTSNNPMTLSYVAPAGENVPDGKIVNVTFNTPSANGEYAVTVTVTPFMDDVECASFSGTGKITVPEPGMNIGLPEGLAYDGEYITWTHADTALGYDIYMVFEGDDYESYVDFAEEPSYYFPWEDYLGFDGLFTFRVYMYDDTLEIVSVSEDLDVVIEADGNIISGGLSAYANVLYDRLTAIVDGNSYSDESQAEIDGYLADATYGIYGAEDYATMTDAYVAYAELLADIPVKKDIVKGVPTGLAYDGTTFIWTAAAGATAYDVYMLYEGNSYEYLLGDTDTNSYEFSAADNITEAGLYTFRVYMYDSEYEITGVSDDLTVVIEADGTVVDGGLSAYAEILAERLSASVVENPYTDENRALLDSYLVDAAVAMSAADDFATLMDTYNDYKTMIDSVPVKKDVVQGMPTGLAYDGETVTWTAAEGASAYDLYILYEGDDTEVLIGTSDTASYVYSVSENITAAGLYTFRVYMLDADSDIVGVSDDLTVVVEADGTVIEGGLAEYATVLSERLSASVADNVYTDENQATVDGYLADAATDMAGAADFATLVETYDSYAALIAEVPVDGEETVILGDVNNDGSIDMVDNALLSQFLRGTEIGLSKGADLNGDGAIDIADKSLLSKKLRTL